MTTLYNFLVFLVAMLVTKITSLYDLTIYLFNYVQLKTICEQLPFHILSILFHCLLSMVGSRVIIYPPGNRLYYRPLDEVVVLLGRVHCYVSQ